MLIYEYTFYLYINCIRGNTEPCHLIIRERNQNLLNDSFDRGNTQVKWWNDDDECKYACIALCTHINRNSEFIDAKRVP